MSSFEKGVWNANFEKCPAETKLALIDRILLLYIIEEILLYLMITYLGLCSIISTIKIVSNRETPKMTSISFVYWKWRSCTETGLKFQTFITEALWHLKYRILRILVSLCKYSGRNEHIFEKSIFFTLNFSHQNPG